MVNRGFLVDGEMYVDAVEEDDKRFEDNVNYGVLIQKYKNIKNMPTIADRGTSADLVSLKIARQLVKEGVVDGILRPDKEMLIQFGVESAKVPVTGLINGRGLLGEVFVIDDDMPTALISDISLVEKGVIFIEDNHMLLGLAAGKVVVTGVRDADTSRSEPNAMWQLNLRELLMQEDPRLRLKEHEKGCQLTAVDIVLIIQQQLQQGELLLDKDKSNSFISCGAKPTFSVNDVRKGRRILKCLGISPFTVARTVEREAWKNIPVWLTPALLRAIGYAKGNIPALMSTARKYPAGGTGIKSVRVGEVVSFDILGKFPASVWGCQYGAQFMDEASAYTDGYGIKNKSDIDEALIRYCQGVEARGKGPVRMARHDAGAEVSKHGELTVAFRKACEKLHLQLVPSAPEDQATNPVERQWQSISHRMANMFLQQDNLIKQQWILVWFAAMVFDRVVCHGDQNQTPCELMCGFVPDLDHVSQFYCGETVLFPRTGKRQHLSSGHDVGVHICPILASKAHLVLIGNSSTPQVRSHLQPVGVELRELTAKELDQLKPTFDPVTGDLLDFHSRAQHKFSLKRAIKSYDEGDDLSNEQDLVLQENEQSTDKILRQELMPYYGPVDSTMRSVQRQQQLKHHNQQLKLCQQQQQKQGTEHNKQNSTSTLAIADLEAAESLLDIRNSEMSEGGIKRAVNNDKQQDVEVAADLLSLGAGNNFSETREDGGSRHGGNEAISAITACTNLFIADQLAKIKEEDDMSAKGIVDQQQEELMIDNIFKKYESGEGQTANQLFLSTFKARMVHTEDNPTVRMLEKDPKLAELWQPATHKEIAGGIAKGFRIILTEEEKVRDGWIEQPLVLVYSTKRDGTRKCRAASDGRAMPASWFDPDDIYAEGLPPMITRLLTAFGARFKMVDASTDVVSCFASQCTWDKSKYPRLICHRLTAYQSPTGKEEWLGNLTNNYGSCDSPGQWRMISRDALINKCKMIPSRICDQLFMQFRGQQGLLVIGQMTDDFKILHTNDEDGRFMKGELLRILQEDLHWEMTQQQQTKDYGSLIHEFQMIDGRRAVTLTQEAQILKAVDLVFGIDRRADIPATYTPLPPEWNAEASAMCQELVTQKEYMGALMTAAWASQTHFESPAISLLACRGTRPTQIDMNALKHYIAYLYTTRKLGITYYESMEGDKSDIRQTVGLRLYTDDGENQHLDGAGHWGILIYLGEMDDGSGAILGASMKATGVIGESVPVNEVMGAAYGIRVAIFLKFILEELSGATRDDLDTTDQTVEGSALPLSCAVSESVITAVQHEQSGLLGEPVLDAAALMLSKAKMRQHDAESNSTYPAVQVFVDNAGVVNNISHISYRSKGLKRVARIVSHLRSLMQQDIVKYVYTSAENQRADALSKQYTSPVRNAETLLYIFGCHPMVWEYVHLVHQLFNKRSGGKRPEDSCSTDSKENNSVRGEEWWNNSISGFDQLQLDNGLSLVEENSINVVAAAARPVEQEARIREAMEKMQSQISFLRSGNGVPQRVMARCGYRGAGGLGMNEDGISTPVEVLSTNYYTQREGVGYKKNYGEGCRIYQVNIGGILDRETEKTGVGLFLAERIRRALLKLTPEERLLFSTRLHDGPFEDVLISDEYLSRLMEGKLKDNPIELTVNSVRAMDAKEIQGAGGARAVLSAMVGAESAATGLTGEGAAGVITAEEGTLTSIRRRRVSSSNKKHRKERQRRYWQGFHRMMNKTK